MKNPRPGCDAVSLTKITLNLIGVSFALNFFAITSSAVASTPFVDGGRFIENSFIAKDTSLLTLKSPAADPSLDTMLILFASSSRPPGVSFRITKVSPIVTDNRAVCHYEYDYIQATTSDSLVTRGVMTVLFEKATSSAWRMTKIDVVVLERPQLRYSVISSGRDLERVVVEPVR